MSTAIGLVMMTNTELKARIAELAKLEGEALAEQDYIRFRDYRGKRNWLESQVK